MRVLLVLLASAALALPASAASIDPQALVVARTEVPRGFRISPSASGLRTNELEAKQYPETRVLFERWRRITGYQVVYSRRDSSILARADVFRGADGARKLLERIDLELRRSGVPNLKRRPATVGDEGWVYSALLGGGYTVVSWRDRRIVATVIGLRLAKANVLALARAQQRRIASALR